jgi:hypothetical protein
MQCPGQDTVFQENIPFSLPFIHSFLSSSAIPSSPSPLTPSLVVSSAILPSPSSLTPSPVICSAILPPPSPLTPSPRNQFWYSILSPSPSELCFQFRYSSFSFFTIAFPCGQFCSIYLYAYQCMQLNWQSLVIVFSSWQDYDDDSPRPSR